MTKRNVMAALNRVPDGSMPKNAFDLHNYEFFHHKLGMLQVVGCRETIPDENLKVGVDAFTLTYPCNTASMADMKENYYFIYVPFNQLFNSSYSFFTQRKDLQSALDYSNEQVPWFPLGDVVCYCIKEAKNNSSLRAKDVHGFNLACGALRLLDMLGYGCYLDFVSAYKNGDLKDDGLNMLKIRLNNYHPNVLRIAAYQKAWYCYFRNMQYDVNISPRAFNFDDIVYHEAGVTPSFNILDHRSLENFVNECLQLRYVGYKKDIFTGCMPGTQYGAVSSISASLTLPFELTGNVTGNTGNDRARWYKSGPFVEDGSLSQNDSFMVFQGSKLANWPGVDPDNPQNGSLNGVTSQYDEQSEETVYGTRVISHDHAINLPVTLSGSGQSAASLFDVLQLVEAQAIQKWKQKSMLAGQKMTNQYRAHYGVVPRHLEDHYPDFIGSVDNILDIDKVINQANTVASDDKTNLGDLGGRGYGASSNRTFNFHSTEHGVILYLKAVVPENLYSSFGLDRANQLINYSDFWQPEFQNIGLEAVPKTLLDVCAPYSANGNDPHAQDSTQWVDDGLILGYAPRNYQLKQYPSRCHGMFNPDRLNLRPDPQTGVIPFGFADIQAFVQPRIDLVTTIRIGNVGDDQYLSFAGLQYVLSKFYVNPSIADNTFVVDADSYEDTDCFYCKARIICDDVAPKTELGLPQF